MGSTAWRLPATVHHFIMGDGGNEADRNTARPRVGADDPLFPTHSGEGAEAGGRGPVDGSAPEEGGEPNCDLCGGPMLDRHCKLLCLRCGYQRDCSDP